MELTAEKVKSVFMDCLYRDDEVIDDEVIPEKAIVVEGIIKNFGFHPERIESHKKEIVDLLMELPATFQKNVGAGWSFLNACQTKDRKQWADLHQDMEALFVLGMAIGKVKYVFPRAMWNTLPGGMPYLVIL